VANPNTTRTTPVTDNTGTRTTPVTEPTVSGTNVNVARRPGDTPAQEQEGS
jgi:hypothetical protein